MKKKVVAISILAVLMIVAISYATAVNTTNTEKKESPLYGLRTRRAITDKIGTILENIKTKFLGDRIFFLPYLLNQNSHHYRYLFDKEHTDRLVDLTCGFKCWTACYDPDCNDTW
jgi:hypothetical protein